MWRKIVTGVAIVMLVAGIGLFLFPIVSNFIGTQIANSETEKFDSQIENVVDDGLTFEDAHEQGKIDDEGYLIDEKGNRKSENPVVFRLDLDRLYKDSAEYNENLKTNQSSLLIDSYSYVQPSLVL